MRAGREKGGSGTHAARLNDRVREARTSTRNLRRTQRGSDRSASGRASRDPVFRCLQHLSFKLVATIAQSRNSRACEARGPINTDQIGGSDAVERRADFDHPHGQLAAAT